MFSGFPFALVAPLSLNVFTFLYYTVGIKFLSHHHFIEVTYNGILRRLLVSSLRATPSSPPVSSTEETIHTISLSTSIVFKPPIAPLPKSKATATSAVSHLGSAPQNGGDLEGYERIGGLEKQIEMIRELVEWPLTRPELFGHFGKRRPTHSISVLPPTHALFLRALKTDYNAPLHLRPQTTSWNPPLRSTRNG